MWNTQEAVDAVTEYKDYNLLLEEEWRERLLTCPINMIHLDPKMSDAEAYDRALIANKCRAFSPAQVIKSMCAKKTFMCTLLDDMSSDKNDALGLFVDDEIYRYNASILRIFAAHSSEDDFRPHAIMIQGKDAIQKANEVLDTDGAGAHDECYNESFAVMVRGASDMARKIMSDMIAEHDPILKKNIPSQVSAVGHMYFALTLACANANAGALATSDYICKEEASKLLDMYLKLDGSQKTDNNRRFYTFFTSGTLPDVPDKSKKRKMSDDNVSELD